MFTIWDLYIYIVVLWCPQGVDGDLRSRHERTNGLVDGDRIRVLTKVNFFLSLLFSN